MRRITRSVAAALALTLTSTLTGSAWSAPAPGYSTPTEDSYYPQHGDPGIDVLRYHLDLRWARKKELLRGVATVRARSTGNTSSLQLALSDALTVTSVTADGAPAVFAHTSGQLVVSGTWAADQLTTLKIAYRGTPRPVKAPSVRSDQRTIGWHTTSTGNVWTMQEPYGAFTWYPANDTPSDKAMYRVRVNVPSKQVGVFNGRMTSRKKSGARTITVFKPGHPIATYLTTLAIAPLMRVRAKAWDGTPINYWIPQAHPEYAKTLSKTPGDFRWLNKVLGPYPFDRVGIVLVPSASAMETQELITFGKQNLQYGRWLIREIVVHELAHSWFGDTATPSDWSDVWLNEGFALYFQLKFAAHKHWQPWRYTVNQWNSDDQYLRDRYGPPGAYDKDAFASNNVYECPARMLNRLSHKVGAANFSRWVKRWVAMNHDANVTRAEFESFIEGKSGLDLTSFFDRWLNSTTAPK